MELSELSLRVEKLEEIIQELAKWTNFKMSTCQKGSLDNIGETTHKNKKKSPRVANVVKSRSEISNDVNDVEEDPMSSVVIKMELEDEDEEQSIKSMEFSQFHYNCEEVTQGVDFPEDSAEWIDPLSNSEEDPLFIPSDGGQHSESASDFEGLTEAEPPKKRRKRPALRKYEPLKVPQKSPMPPSEPFVSLRQLTPSQLPTMKNAQKPNDLKCPSCSRKFKIKIAFSGHIRSGICQKGARPFACPHCPYAAATKGTLSEHIKAIHPATEEERLHRPFDCPDPECPKAFKFKRDLTKHISSMHTTAEKTFLCESCPYLGKNYNNLQQHINKNHTEINLFCYFCPWKGRRLDKLTAHMRTHTGEKPYKCPHCIYTSTNDDTLKIHVKIHGTNEGSFECSKCPSKFKTHGNLGRHLKIHDGSAYKCGICGFEAFNNASLRNHYNDHKTEDGQMFQCPHCPKTCKSSRNLAYHIRMHTGEKPYECGKCEYASARNSDLKQHKKICKGNRTEKPEEKNKNLKSRL